MVRWPWKKERRIASAIVWAIAGVSAVFSLFLHFDHPADSAVPGTAVLRLPISSDESPLKVVEAAPVTAATVAIGAHLPRLVPLSREEPAWRKNAVHVATAPDQPMIAIVIDDIGPNRRNSLRAVELPAPLTMSVLPYASDLETLVARARANGHEIMVHLPMEAERGDKNPGPGALEIGQGEAKILKRMRWNLERFAGYVGINNHMGSRFTADREAMAVVMDEVARRGLLYLDSRTTPRSVGGKLARASHVPAIDRDVFLDNVPDREAIARQLALLEKIAEKHGAAVAIGHPYDATLETLAHWIADATARGFALVPISRIAERNRPLWEAPNTDATRVASREAGAAQ